MINRQNFIKAVVYRLYSSVITFLVAYLLTDNFIASISIGFLDALIKIISYYFFDEFWVRITGFKPKPAVVWLTGLSGSGKTTIALDLVEKLKKNSVMPVLLDGDILREVFKQHRYDEESRKKHNLNVGYIASLFEKQGNIVIVALISPYDDIRNEVRKMCTNFIEVYISTDLETCIKRDPKGLYKKALSGEIKEFTGISAPYFPPSNPELILDTNKYPATECTDLIMKFLKSNLPK